MIDLIRKGLTQLGVLAANPLSFVFVAAFTVVWYVVERHTLDWHGVATMLTLIIALVIHRSTHRDAQALQAKLDELLEALPGARNALAAIDDAEPEDIARHRDGEPNKYRT
jgi:low affinity Fe/Cu permease